MFEKVVLDNPTPGSLLIMDASILWTTNRRFLQLLFNANPRTWTSLIHTELQRINITRGGERQVIALIGTPFKRLRSTDLMDIATRVRRRKPALHLPIPLYAGPDSKSTNLMVVGPMPTKDILQMIVMWCEFMRSTFPHKQIDIACADQTLLMMSNDIDTILTHPLNPTNGVRRTVDRNDVTVSIYALTRLTEIWGIPATVVSRLKKSFEDSLVDQNLMSLATPSPINKVARCTLARAVGHLSDSESALAFSCLGIHEATSHRHALDAADCGHAWLHRYKYLSGNLPRPYPLCVFAYTHLSGFHSGSISFAEDMSNHIVIPEVRPPDNVRYGVRKAKLRKRKRFDLIPTRTTIYQSRVIGDDTKNAYAAMFGSNKYSVLAFPDVVVAKLGSPIMTKRAAVTVVPPRVHCGICDALRAPKHICTAVCSICKARHGVKKYRCEKCPKCNVFRNAAAKHVCFKDQKAKNKANTKTTGVSQRKRLAEGVAAIRAAKKVKAETIPPTENAPIVPSRVDPRKARAKALGESGLKRSAARCLGRIPDSRLELISLVQEKRRILYQGLSDHVSNLSDDDFKRLVESVMSGGQNAVMRMLRCGGKCISEEESVRPDMAGFSPGFSETVRSMFGTNLIECIKRAYLQIDTVVEGASFTNLRQSRREFAEMYPGVQLVALVPKASNTPHSNPESPRPLKCLATYMIENGLCGLCQFDNSTLTSACNCSKSDLVETDTSWMVSIVYGKSVGARHRKYLTARDVRYNIKPLGTVVVSDFHMYILDDTIEAGYEMPIKCDGEIAKWKAMGCVAHLTSSDIVRYGKQNPCGGELESERGFRERLLYIDELVSIYSDMRERLRQCVVVTVDVGRIDARFVFGYMNRMRYLEEDGQLGIPTRSMTVTVAEFRAHGRGMIEHLSDAQRTQCERNLKLDSEFWVDSTTGPSARYQRIRRNVEKQRRDTRILNKIRNKAREWSRGKLRDIVIVYGDSGPGHEQKKQTGFGSTLLSLLTRHFTVTLIDEFRTSAVCPFCHANRVGRNVASGGHAAFKHIECACPSLVPRSIRMSTVVQRDIRACYNMLRMVIDIVVTGRIGDIFLRASPRKRDLSRTVQK